LKAVKINTVLFKSDRVVIPLVKNNMKYQIHYGVEKSVSTKEENKLKNRVKKKGN